MQAKSDAIFTQLRDIIYDKEFTNAQDLFFEKHYQEFEDTEENKLVYTQIYEQFVELLEQIIVAKLEVNHSSDDIDQFYGSFVENMPRYEAEDPVTVNSLFSFIDFDKFKTSILQYKADRKNIEESQGKSTSIGDELDLNLLQQLLAQDINDPANKWVKKLDKTLDHGLISKFYSTPNEGGISMTRGDHIMPEINMNQVDLFLREIDTRNSDPYLKEIRILERDASGYPTQYYTISKLPMMTDRESLMSMQRIEQGDKVIYIIKSIEREDFPRSNKMVRMDFFKAVEYTKLESGGLSAIEFVKFDLGGYFPTSILNMLQVSAGQKQIQEFYNQARAMPK